MRLQPEHLATLLAIVDTGTFDAAARRLHVTPSAVSQRVKALEAEVGQVVVVRGHPVPRHVGGEALVRLARQQRLLESEALAGLATDGRARVDLPIVVNADSMSTWFGARADRGRRLGRRRAAPAGSRTRTTRLGCSARVRCSAP